MTQNKAISVLKTGANVFLTGEPGSGKTYTVNKYVEYLRSHEIRSAVTASTGIAATHLGGMTIHSWSGIGIKKQLTIRDLKKIHSNRRLVSRARKACVLIIDEISMLDSEVLSSIDLALKTLRESNKPFGGLQVVFVGDFFQLPPVTKYGEKPVRFAFDSIAWQETKPIVCYLSEQHRQDDSQFLSLLASIRSGKKSSLIHSALNARKKQISMNNSHTRLYTHNIDVNRVNDRKLSTLPRKEHEFLMETQGPKPLVGQLQKGCLSPETLVLKIGAQVMFTKNNFETGFVNGTQGVVVKFTNEGDPVVQTKSTRRIKVLPMEWTIDDGVKTLATITQIPLKLAWAITVHKSQGMTLDVAVIDLSGAFEYGQGYVAISRVKSLSGLFILGYNNRSLEVHPEILLQDITFRRQSQEAVTIIEHNSPKDMKREHEKFILKSNGKLKKSAPKLKPVMTTNTYEQTYKMFAKGYDIDKIAKERGLTRGTILKHTEKLLEKGSISKDKIKSSAPARLLEALPEIRKVFEEVGSEYLSPAFAKLKGKHSYDDLRIARILID